MTFLELCRNKAFWAIDALNGGKVKKALDIIEKCDKGIWSEDEIDAYQHRAIENLLNHARGTVKAYNNQETLNLNDWPVVRKTDLKDNVDDHISNRYNKNHLFVMSTSGSTGTPFRSYQDVGKKRHVNAEVLYYNGLVDFKIGRKIIYLRSLNSETIKSRLTQFAQNIRLIDCAELGENVIKARLDEIRKHSSKGGCMLLGYASTLDAFRKYFQKFGYEDAEGCNVYGIVSGSEMLQDITRSVLEKSFKCKVVSRYSNEENGFFGQDDVDNNFFIINRADYYYEILKFDSDLPADDGEVGRIVVTDLYNYAMPFIRYDTGDVGAWCEATHWGKKVRAIGNFGGRVVDMLFDTKGNMVSPHSITNMMWKYQGVQQFQFVQKSDNKYVINLNVEINSFTQEKLLCEEIKGVFGNDAIISVEYCNEIPVLASGKRRYIVNEMLAHK